MDGKDFRKTVGAKPSRGNYTSQPLGPKQHDPSQLITPLERQTMESFGVQPGENINLSGNPAAVAHSQNLLNGPLVRDPQKAKPMQPGTRVQLSGAAPAETASIYKTIDEQRQANQAREAQRASEAAMPASMRQIPGAAQAYQTAVGNEPTLTIHDDISRPQARGFEQPDIPQPTPQPVSPPPPPPADKPATRPAATITVCGMCGRDPSHKAAEVTSTDKLHFLETEILGGVRFTKAYTLYGDRVRVTFRNLTPDEANLARRQTDEDALTKQIKTFLAYSEHVSHYRLCMSIDSIHIAGQAPVELATVSEINAADGYTPLQRLERYVMTQILKTDALYNAIAHDHLQFRHIVHTCEANRDKPDFF